MSFIVKGIDFPEECGDCPCCVEYDNGDCVYYEKYHTGMFCSAQDSAPDVYDIHKKLNNCSLVEISSPHGRLIDADELIKKLERHRDMCGDIETQCGGDVLKYLCPAPYCRDIQFQNLKFVVNFIFNLHVK